MISLKTDNQLNTEAIKLREKWGLNHNGSIDITSVVLSKLPNLTLLYIPFSENTSGMCIKDGNIEIIGINSTMTKPHLLPLLPHLLPYVPLNSGGHVGKQAGGRDVPRQGHVSQAGGDRLPLGLS